MAVVSTPWQWQFPPIVADTTIYAQLGKVFGEVVEVIKAYDEGKGDDRIVEELMDVIHAAETALRIFEEYDDDIDLDFEKRYVVLKNDKRGYYG